MSWSMGRFGLTRDDLNNLIRLLTTDGLVVPDPDVVPIGRDPKDSVVLASKVDSGHGRESTPVVAEREKGPEQSRASS